MADDRIRHLRGRVAHAVGRDGQIRQTLSTNRGVKTPKPSTASTWSSTGRASTRLWFTTLFSQDALDLLELGLGGPLSG